jgi:hypothetical protein
MSLPGGLPGGFGLGVGGVVRIGGGEGFGVSLGGGGLKTGRSGLIGC